MIQEAVNQMKLKEALRKNEEYRNKKFRQKHIKKEADTAATVTTSSGLTEKKPLNNYTKESEECQDVKSDTSGDTSDGEVRQQGPSELPVYLL